MIFDFKDHPTELNKFMCQVYIVQVKLGEMKKESLTWSDSMAGKMGEYLKNFEKGWTSFIKYINIPNCDINVDTYYLVTSKLVSQQVKYQCSQYNEEVNCFF